MSGCWSCSGRLFHSVGPAVAKLQSPNWLHDLLTTARAPAYQIQCSWKTYSWVVDLANFTRWYISNRWAFLGVFLPNLYCTCTETGSGHNSDITIRYQATQFPTLVVRWRFQVSVQMKSLPYFYFRSIWSNDV